MRLESTADAAPMIPAAITGFMVALSSGMLGLLDRDLITETEGCQCAVI